MFPNIGKSRRKDWDGGSAPHVHQRPFHETIVEQLGGMRPVNRIEFNRMSWLVTHTKMPTGHKKVLDALTGLARRSGFNDDALGKARQVLGKIIAEESGTKDRSHP
ncbi:MAG: hypothetical protein WD883_00825 [Candidatus Colwellbacteria bacterium]